MSTERLFQIIAEAIRRDIYADKLKPGEALPTVRELATQYGCAPGTVQRAYRQLADEGLVISRVGQGTCVAGVELIARDNRLLHLKLVNRIEAFVLDLMGIGHTTTDIEAAMRLALDSIVGQSQQMTDREPMRFSGSHDPALSMTCSHIASDYPIEMTFVGSMNGLLELAHGKADFSGCHLYDGETHSYNTPFIRRLFNEQEIAVLTVARRHLGLIVAPENPLAINALYDLIRPEIRFVNRQAGAGTRLWLDAQLEDLGLSPADIQGYSDVAYTHSEVAKLVLVGDVDVGIGVEAAAQVYGLGFIPLTTEQYDLVIPTERWQMPAMQALVGSLQSDRTRQAIHALGGYDTSNTGQLNWVS